MPKEHRAGDSSGNFIHQSMARASYAWPMLAFATEDTEMDELMPEARTTRQVIIDAIMKKRHERVRLPAECKSELSKLHQRRLLISQLPGGKSCVGDEATHLDMQHRYLLRAELAAYMVKRTEQEADNSCLLQYWTHRAIPTVAAGTNDIALPAKLPHVALVARLYLSIGTSSCQAERNFSALSFVIGELRTRMTATKFK